MNIIFVLFYKLFVVEVYATLSSVRDAPESGSVNILIDIAIFFSGYELQIKFSFRSKEVRLRDVL